MSVVHVPTAAVQTTEAYSWISSFNNRVLKLSDSSVAFVAIEGNATATLTQLKIFHSSDRSTWTLKATLTPASGRFWESPYFPYAATIDAANNIHIAWIGLNGTVRTIYYVRYTYSAGPTWTVGTVATVYTSVAATVGQMHGLALEAYDADNVVLSAIAPSGTGTLLGQALWVRNSSGWGAIQYAPNQSSASLRQAWGNVMSRSFDAIAGGTAQLATMWASDPTAAVNFQVHTIDFTNRVRASTNTISETFLGGQPGSGWRGSGELFPSASGRWRYVTATAPMQIRSNWYYEYTGTVQGWAGEISATQHTIPSTSSPIYEMRHPHINTWHPVAMYTGERGGIFWGHRNSSWGSTFGIRSSACDFVDNSITWSQDFTLFDLGSTVPQAMWASAPRNFNSTVDFFYWNLSVGRLEHLTNNAVIDDFVDPNAITPRLGQTVVTNMPTLGAAVYFSPGNRLVPRGIEWTVATDSGFTANVRSIFERVGTYSNIVAQHARDVPLAQKLTQTTWRIRARILDPYGRAASVFAYPPSNSFIVSHPPTSTNHTPSNNEYLDFGTLGEAVLAWQFADTSPDDAQTAYRVIVERNSDLALIYDSNKVVSTASSVAVAIPAVNKDQELRWRVSLWDANDVQGSYSADRLFYIGDKPTVAITAPADSGTVDNPSPVVNWTFTAGGSRMQNLYRVTFTSTTSGLVAYDSGWILSDLPTHQMNQAALLVSQTYRVTVQVEDTGGLQNSDTHTFSTVWTPPAAPGSPGVNPTPFSESGYFTISWSVASLDADFYSFRVYRRLSGTTDWAMVYQTSDKTTASWNDWWINASTSYDYAVVQVANRFGTLVESSYTWMLNKTSDSPYYWLMHPDDNSLNIRLYTVVSDSYSEEYEQETLNLIGRGRKTDYGDRFGYTGTLVSHIRGNCNGKTAREIKMELELIKSELRDLYLRNPFGDTWLVAIGNLQIGRIAGVANQEMVDVTIPYQEVS